MLGSHLLDPYSPPLPIILPTFTSDFASNLLLILLPILLPILLLIYLQFYFWFYFWFYYSLYYVLSSACGLFCFDKIDISHGSNSCVLHNFCRCRISSSGIVSSRWLVCSWNMQFLTQHKGATSQISLRLFCFISVDERNHLLCVVVLN